eukprot:TCALIF_01977-PA protein Name:"Similar to LSM12 Protein LSM12 homolog (Pongo abelii)" AED:0.05 eAED:0.08 QI:0/0.75/0.6/1/1/1/5/298/490
MCVCSCMCVRRTDFECCTVHTHTNNPGFRGLFATSSSSSSSSFFIRILPLSPLLLFLFGLTGRSFPRPWDPCVGLRVGYLSVVMVKKESGTPGPVPLTASGAAAPTAPASSPYANHFYEVSPHAATAPTAEAAGSSVSLAFEYFMPGARVKCTSCYGDNLEGEVMAFDLNTRMLVLKMSATDRRPSHNDVQMLNMNYMKDVKLLSEAKNNNGTPPADPPTLNIQRVSSVTSQGFESKSLKNSSSEVLKNRIGQNLVRKGRLIKAFKSGVSVEGQRLFQVISKTIDEIDWEGENIVVMRKVTITPPYKPENIKGVSDSKAVLHITKIVEKHVEDERDSTAKASQSRNSSASPAKSASPSQSVGGVGGGKDAATPVDSQQSAPPSASASTSSSPRAASTTPTSGSSAPSQAGPTQANNNTTATTNNSSSSSSSSSNNNQRNTNGPRQQGGGQDRRSNNSNNASGGSHASSTSNNSGRNGPSGNQRSSAAKPM